MAGIKCWFFSLLLGLGIAFAQNNEAPLPSVDTRSLTTAWFGLNTGYINSSYPFGLALHFGVLNPAGPHLRLSGSLQFREGATSLGLAADSLTTFVYVSPLMVYGGGGGAIVFESNSFLIDAHGLVGVEYSLSNLDLEEFALFLEIRLGAALALGDIPQPAIPAVAALIGFNIYF